MGPQCEVLEHKSDLAAVRREEASPRTGSLDILQPDFALVGHVKTGDQPQQGGLPTSAEPEDHDRLTGCDRECHVVERLMRPEASCDVPERDGSPGHRASRTDTAIAKMAKGLRMTTVCSRAKAATCEGGVFAIIV